MLVCEFSFTDFEMCSHLCAFMHMCGSLWRDGPVVPPLSIHSVSGLYLLNNQALSPDTPGPTVALGAAALRSYPNQPDIFPDICSIV